jgi:hypothetical protein
MAGRPSGRFRRPPEDYEEVDLERALVPSMSMMPAGAPGLPGMPGVPTEHDERLLGIRRPVYIPVTEKKRRRVPSWRVITGILSIMLMCVASCGLATVFGPKYLSSVWGVAGVDITPAPPNYLNVPLTPVATPGAGAKYIVSVTTAKRLDSSYHPVDIASFFYEGQTIYVVAQVRNAPTGAHKVCVHWFVNGLDPQLGPNAQLCQATNGKPDLTAFFSISFLQTGYGTAQIYWDPPDSEKYTYKPASDPALAQTIYFGVLVPGAPTPKPPTPTPVPTATPKVTPSPRGATPTPT